MPGSPQPRTPGFWLSLRGASRRPLRAFPPSGGNGSALRCCFVALWTGPRPLEPAGRSEVEEGPEGMPGTSPRRIGRLLKAGCISDPPGFTGTKRGRHTPGARTRFWRAEWACEGAIRTPSQTQPLWSPHFCSVSRVCPTAPPPARPSAPGGRSVSDGFVLRPQQLAHSRCSANASRVSSDRMDGVPAKDTGRARAARTGLQGAGMGSAHSAWRPQHHRQRQPRGRAQRSPAEGVSDFTG